MALSNFSYILPFPQIPQRPNPNSSSVGDKLRCPLNLPVAAATLNRPGFVRPQARSLWLQLAGSGRVRRGEEQRQREDEEVRVKGLEERLEERAGLLRKQ